MKTLISFLLISASAYTQTLSGVEEYQPVDRLSFNSDKQYIYTEDTYDFQVQDEFDNKISLSAMDIVWDEMFRIMEKNDVKDVVVRVVAGPRDLTHSYKDIAASIKNGCNYIVIRYDMGNGYFAYLNLQDGFCGMAITKEEI